MSKQTSPLGRPTAAPPRPSPALSPTARAFGAEISVADHGSALFYLVARTGTPDAAVRSVGGEVVARLLTPREALAMAPLAAHAALRNHLELELAGPVTVDPERFRRFTRLIGLHTRTKPQPGESK